MGTQPACTGLLLSAQIQDRNRLFSLGVEHSLSKRKVDGSNPSIGLHFCSPSPVLLFIFVGLRFEAVADLGGLALLNECNLLR